MKLHELRAVPGSTKERKRRGRGHATGQGTTGGSLDLRTVMLTLHGSTGKEWAL